MKKLLLITMLLVIIVLAACNSEDSAEQGEDNKEEDVEEVNSEDRDEQRDDDAENKEEKENLDQKEEQADKEEVVEEIEPQYQMTDQWTFTPIEDGDPEVVLLTIDDVPDGQALEMAETLKELDASAIFFVNGIFMENEKDREIIKQIHDMGFAIGNHTYSHHNLQDLSEEEQYEEIISLNELIEEVIGEKPKFFRAPHGANTDYASELVKEEGMLLMNWTYGYDYFEPYMEAEKLQEAMISGKAPEIDVPNSLLRDGANLLMHDREWTNDALEDIVEGLREQGYEMLDPESILTPQDEE
ncbi:polysaccharide deacetylase family protein [Alkalibacillus silvisoli]|uniref:NodB homology domain-containing protein n=1 Tax=Alkalibacillus silvisoli TaxID=392823 RepID=A0ABN0ZMU4_9BACI